MIENLEEAIATFGFLKDIGWDNGPEFLAYGIQDWLGAQRIGPLSITTGSPWEQVSIESFHDKLRAECTNIYRDLFGNLPEAQVILKVWRKTYNQTRPHSSLGYQTREEFAGDAKPRGSSQPITNAELHL